MIYLTRVDPARHMDRWYSVAVQSTLLDRWAVVCAWGRRRSSYLRLRIISAKNLMQAQEMAENIVVRKIHKGYIRISFPI